MSAAAGRFGERKWHSRCARRRLINLVVDFPGHAPVVGELQIHYRPILELKEYELHFHYEIMRAKGISELIP